MKYIIFLFAFAITNVWAQPQWAQNPISNPDFYTGIGIGDSLSAAKLDAKNQIVSSIRSTHSYFLSQTIETTGNRGEQKTASKVSSSSNEVLLPEVAWVNSTSKNGLFYTLGRVDKKEFVQLYEQHLDISLSNYQSHLNKQNFSFSEYITLVSYRPTLEQLAERASFISGYSEKGKKHLAQIITLLKNISNHGDSICMRVVYKGSSSFEKRIFLPMVENAFSSSGLVLRNTSDCEPVNININSHSTRNGEDRIDKITLFIDVGSPSVISKNVTFFGQSSGSKKNSYADSVMNFYRHFNQKNNFGLFILDESKSSLVIQR